MRFTVYSIFIFAVVFGFWIGNHSEVDQSRMPSSEADYGKTNQDFVDGLTRYLRWLPEQEKQAFKDYFSLISNVNKWSSQSVELKFKKMVEQPCFGELASRYYLHRMSKDVDNLERQFQNRYEKAQLPDVIALSERAGDGYWQNEKPGEVWNEVLKFAKGDSHLAMYLLGVCGHDNQIQRPPTLPNSNKFFEKLVAEKARLAETINHFALARSTLPINQSEKNRLKIFSKLHPFPLPADQKATLKCLPTSALYLPGALGSEIDLPEGLKRKITDAQAPTQGRSALPAKSYHFVGSALSACELRSHSRLGSLAIIANPLAARAYRALRLNELVSGPTVTVNGKKQPPTDYSYLNGFLQENLTEEYCDGLIKKRMALPLTGTSQEEEKFFNSMDGRLVYLAFNSTDNLNEIGPKKLRRRILAAWARKDAAELARQWYQPIDVPGIGSLLFPNPSRRPEFVQNQIAAQSGVIPFTFLFPSNKYQCAQPGWSKLRCKNAIDTLDSWEVDFDWTQQAHRIGAQFGLSKCRRLKPEETIESMACKALKETGGNSQEIDESETVR